MGDPGLDESDLFPTRYIPLSRVSRNKTGNNRQQHEDDYMILLLYIIISGE